MIINDGTNAFVQALHNAEFTEYREAKMFIHLMICALQDAEVTLEDDAWVIDSPLLEELFDTEED